MYVPHKSFTPPDKEVIIWRYMDFTKFISLLSRKELYFARADTFEDKFEGSHTSKNIEERRESLNEIKNRNFIGKDDFVEELFNVTSHMSKNMPQQVYINCWHMNANESAAMWKLYVRGGEGIAIQSKFSKLKDSLIDSHNVYAGVVKYLDYSEDTFPQNNLFTPFTHKRKSFEHERELRAAVSFRNLPDQPLGLNIKIDIEKLIENVYVSPDSQPWFSDLVKSVIEKYEYKFKVVGSELSPNERPLF